MTRAQTRTTDFAATNLRGSPVPLYIAGARVIASYPFGPRTGTALNATVLSYCDELHLGLNIDPAAVTDVDAFMTDVADSFDALLGIALSGSRLRAHARVVAFDRRRAIRRSRGSRQRVCRHSVARSIT